MSRTADPTSRIALLRAAEEVFSERGLPGAKVEEITRRAGLSKGAFYLHFDSKENAFLQVTESFLARCGAMLPKPTDDAVPQEPRALLAYWLDIDEQLFEFLWQNRAIVHIVFACQGEHVYLLEAFNAEIRANSRAWIRFWKARDLFHQDLDDDLVATLICGAYNELSRKMVATPKKPDLRAWVALAQSMVVRGFGTPTLVRALPIGRNGTVE